jgi:hypothetical protein
LICFIKLFDVCAFVLGNPMRTQLKESLPCSSKVKDTRCIEDLLRSLFDCVDCLSLLSFCSHIPKDESYLDHQYDLKRGTPNVVLFSFLLSLVCLGI